MENKAELQQIRTWHGDGQNDISSSIKGEIGVCVRLDHAGTCVSMVTWAKGA